jgi:hypothetical protein
MYFNDKKTDMILICIVGTLGTHKIRRNGRNSHITREKNVIKTSQREATSTRVDIRVMTSLWHALHRDVFSNEFFKIVLQ